MSDPRVIFSKPVCGLVAGVIGVEGTDEVPGVCVQASTHVGSRLVVPEVDRKMDPDPQVSQEDRGVVMALPSVAGGPTSGM